VRTRLRSLPSVSSISSLRNTFLTSRTGLKATTTESIHLEEHGPEIAVDPATPETILIERANSQMIQKAIDDLPIYFREILLLCEVEEMSYQEISDTLSIPMGTVMSRHQPRCQCLIQKESLAFA
jgi:RNA polymerase sigma-70 factor (ECF subfamily)